MKLVCENCGAVCIVFEDPDYIRVVDGHLDLGIPKHHKCTVCTIAEREGVDREVVLKRLTDQGHFR